MRLDERLLHPRVRAHPDHLSSPEHTYLDTLQALADSLRSSDEMAEAASVLNPLLDVRLAAADATAYDEVAGRILKAAQGARDARSGMGVDLCLDYLRLSLDDARTLIG